MKFKVFLCMMVTLSMMLVGCAGDSGSSGQYQNGSNGSGGANGSATVNHKSGTSNEISAVDENGNAIAYSEYVEDSNFDSLYYVQDILNACPNTVVEQYWTSMGSYGCDAVRISDVDEQYQNCTFYVFDSRESAIEAFDYIRDVWYTGNFSIDNNLEVLGLKSGTADSEVALYGQLNNNLIITHNDSVANDIVYVEGVDENGNALIDENGAVIMVANPVSIEDTEAKDAKNEEIHNNIMEDW